VSGAARPGAGHRVRWGLEAAAFRVWLALCRRLSPEAASNLGGWIGRHLGPHLPVTAQAEANLRRALPALDAAERARILRGLWDNLGRVAGEYPHLAAITDPASGRVVVEGFERLDAAFRGAQGAIAFSGHLANWEVMHVMVARRAKDCTTLVRDPNNPWVRAPLERCRAVGGGRRSPKGGQGARDLMATLRRGGLVAMLVDQRLREGVWAPFFGIEAPGPAAPAQAALRLGVALYPVTLARTGPARFRMTVHPALELPPADAGDTAARVRTIATEMNAWLESVIRAQPEDWLWLHRRWGKTG